MKILKNAMWSWWELGIVKWSSFLCGIAIGSYWSEFFRPYILVVITIGLLLGVVGLVRWLKK